MMAKGRIAVGLLLSTVVHGAILATIKAGRSFQPEPVQAGRLSVVLRESSTEGQPRANEPSPVAPEERTKGDPELSRAGEPGPQEITAESTGAVSGKATQSPVESEQRPLHATEATPKESKTAHPSKIASATAPEEASDASQRTDEPPVRKTEQVSDSPEIRDSNKPKVQPTAPDVSLDGVAPGARKAVQARLEDELAKHFHYPFLARRRGWEGQVVLRLRIDSRGEIDSTEIATSSGHAVLDRAALAAIAKVERIPGAAERLKGAGLYLKVPVIYRLREG